jgi:hypothetical protein
MPRSFQSIVRKPKGNVMEASYRTIDEPATADYVLAVLRDEHRQASQFDPDVDPDAELSFDTTIAEWRTAGNMLPWRALGRAYNKHWGIECSDSEWYAALEPAGEKHLSDLCQLIAQHAIISRIRPLRLLGTECLPGGAFLTIRSLLHEAGADADEIRPSTPLAEFTRRYYETFLIPIARLAPGSLPSVRIRAPLNEKAAWMFMSGALLLALGWCVSMPLLVVVGGFLRVFCGAIASIFAWYLPPASVEFGSLHTFRDLAMVIAGACHR